MRTRLRRIRALFSWRALVANLAVLVLTLVIVVSSQIIRMTRAGWRAKGGIELNARVTEFCKDILAKAESVALPENMVKELDSIVSRADTKLQ